MAYRAGDSEKLVMADTVTIDTTSGSPWAVTKGMTVSNPATLTDRFFLLPDPSTVSDGMRFEIKDGRGNAEDHPITVSAPANVAIDSSTDPDTISRNYGGKTYVVAGSAYIIAGDVRDVLFLAPPSGSVSESFGGSAGDPIPSGWTQSQTGSWLNGNGVWSISGDLWDATGSNSTSAIAEGELGGGNSTTYLMWDYGVSPHPVSTLTYDAGTLTAGTVVTWQWRKDFYYDNYHYLRFRVNGSWETTCPSNNAWNAGTYTIPTTAPYIFEFEWKPQNHLFSQRQYTAHHSSCFIDSFTIS